MAQRAKPLVELYYDVASPYSWLGVELFTRLRPVWNLDLVLRPFLLGGVMQATGNKPPGMLAPRLEYMNLDLKRNAKYFNLPINPDLPDPTSMFRTMKAQRLLTSARLDNPELVEPLSKALWIRLWSRHEDIDSEAGLLAACAAALIDPDLSKRLVAGCNDDRVKSALKEVTAEAVARGAYGAPVAWITPVGSTTSHMFFGSDRFHLIASLLGQHWDPAALSGRPKL